MIIDHNCTTTKMAEQLDIPLWKAMELGHYFTKRFEKKMLNVEEIHEELCVFVMPNGYSDIRNFRGSMRRMAYIIHTEQEKRLEVNNG